MINIKFNFYRNDTIECPPSNKRPVSNKRSSMSVAL